MSGQIVERLAANRLRLSHGPIDVLATIEANQESQDRAVYSLSRAFDWLLEGLVDELQVLRSEPDLDCVVVDRTAKRMVAATLPVSDHAFVTPMAAVAGAVSDTLLGAVDTAGVDRLIVNNGGDIAFHLGRGQHLDVGLADVDSGTIGGSVRLGERDRVRGIATSGRGGRSLTLGIADSVTVFAVTAAAADAAATVIASACDLVGSTKVHRRPANDVDASSGLDDRRVVVGVEALTVGEADEALGLGLALAKRLQDDGLIQAAALRLGPSYAVLEPATDSDTIVGSGKLELAMRQ